MCGHISVQNNSWFGHSSEPMLTVWEVTPRSVLSPPPKNCHLLLFFASLLPTFTKSGLAVFSYGSHLQVVLFF